MLNQGTSQDIACGERTRGGGEDYPLLIKMNGKDYLEGDIRSFHVAEKLVDEGYADLVSMSRPFICEPGLVKRWASGDHSRARCLSDNRCFGSGNSGDGVCCLTMKRSFGMFQKGHLQLGSRRS